MLAYETVSPVMGEKVHLVVSCPPYSSIEDRCSIRDQLLRRVFKGTLLRADSC